MRTSSHVLPAPELRFKQATSDSIVAHITDAIVRHRLPPGTKLGEEVLGEVFQVSRTKVRQALFQLARDRLVTLIPARGAYVAQPSVQEAREVFDARRVLEREIVARYAKQATPEQIRALRKHISGERAAAATEEPQRPVQLLGEFHILLADTVGNSVVSEILRELVARTSLITLLYQSAEISACSSDDHATIVAALERHRAERAIAMMIEHLERLERGLNLREPENKSIDLKSVLMPRN